MFYYTLDLGIPVDKRGERVYNLYMNKTAAATGRATLKDIARIAGVSVSTVSIVLTGKSVERRISAEVAQRVREVAAQQDYSPNLLMNSLRRGRTHVLSFYNGFGHRDRDDLYMDRLSTAVERAAGMHKYDVLVHCDYTCPPEESYRRLNGGLADGLLFFGPGLDDPLLALLGASRLPTVVLNHAGRDSSLLSFVRDDSEDGMRRVADELAALGHRRIAAISHRGATDPEENWVDAAARIAFLRARLIEHGLDLPPERVIPMCEGVVDLDHALKELLGTPESPTALFCWHDRVGYQVLEACDRLGIRVPEQLSVVGYDGLHWPSRSRHVLASVAVDMDALAEQAVVLLDDLIEGRLSPPQQQVLPVTLTQGTTLATAP